MCCLTRRSPYARFQIAPVNVRSVTASCSRTSLASARSKYPWAFEVRGPTLPVLSGLNRLACGLPLVVWLAIIGVPTVSAADWMWAEVPGNGAPTNRSFLSAVWTGSEVVYWGGQVHDGNYQWLNSGYRYRPHTGEWKPITKTGAPTARYLHSAIWTGREMILWGGQPIGSHELASSGGCYDPNTDSWRPTSLVNVPRGRLNHTAVWTGREMIVWGGYDTDGSSLNSGGRYNPRTDTWSPTAIADAPSARSSHAAVWTGREMLVWGGYVLKCSSMWDCYNEYPSSYGRYDPIADAWMARSSLPGAPALRAGCSALWDGCQMIVWGGYNGPSYGKRTHLQSGGRFDPSNETWLPTTLDQAPSARDEHVVVWTGTEMLVWGGIPDQQTGGHYRPELDSWMTGAAEGVPSGILAGKAVWTGEAMLVFTDRLYEYFQPGPYAHDGLPDDWQRRHFGEVNPAAAPEADPDGDQQSNQFEFLAGTDPRDRQSKLNLWCEPVAGQHHRFKVGFSPVLPDRTYSLGQSFGLGTDPFLQADIATADAQGTIRWITLPESEASCAYFRLGISLP